MTQIPIAPEPDDDLSAEEVEALLAAAALQPASTESAKPLFATLLSRVIKNLDPDDDVLADFVAHVVPAISRELAHVAAKGGNFAQEKLDEGAHPDDVERYRYDQSMRAHILNGLLPVARIARLLQRWQAPRFRDDFDETAYRLFCAGYTLHDWLKLPGVQAQLEAIGLCHQTVNVAAHRNQVEQIIVEWCQRLGLDQFLDIKRHLHALIYIAVNTQQLHGTMRNLAALPGVQQAGGRKVKLATDLATLADCIAYLGRTPVEVVTNRTIQRQIELFSTSELPLRLTCHHLADVRGVLTSLINNAVIKLYANEFRVPLLFAPTGVVYLERAGAAPAPTPAQVADAVIETIRQICAQQLANSLTGINRDGKGLKYADYYDLFFAPAKLVHLIARFAEQRITKSSAGGRYQAIRDKQLVDAQILQTLDLDLPDTVEVDRIAEVCALAVKIAQSADPSLEADRVLLEAMGLAAHLPAVRAINTSGKTGGVPYGWYYAAGLYRKAHPGLDDQQWVERLYTLVETLAQRLPAEPAGNDPRWNDLRDYIQRHLTLGGQTPAGLSDRLQIELERYSNARKTRGATNVCSLCSSPYTITAQQEAAILFAPMVYTNKQPLHGSKAIRHICSICSFEIMLRQLLMKRGAESGKNFENRKLRYLYFYPTYFFTPETLGVLRLLYDQLKRVSFTELRKTLLDGGLDLSPARFQQLEQLWVEPVDPAQDRLFRLHFPPNEPITFSFIGIPPLERDPADSEAWVTPAFLALLLPLLIDIKVVASESMLPIIQEANELYETVAFDGAHPAVVRLAGSERINLDQVVPALQRLVSGYIIHLDGNARPGRGGYEYKWNQLPALSRDLITSPLYAFHYLKRGLRNTQREIASEQQTAAYLTMVEEYLNGRQAMSHARELVNRYRRFYRHQRGRMNSNAILRPISEAAKALLIADLRLFNDEESLVEAVRGRLEKFIERVENNRAEGIVPGWLYEGADRRQAIAEAIDDFARYFVHDIFYGVFKGDRAALAGKQLNLLKNACESVYMAEQRREWRERNQPPEEKVVEEA
ncbi:MAG: type I-D CRISPR-associated protein Cas10d/Csc3 [Chloroflexus sp.]|nr:type I-D CRISPR-associated protein Cas10d/Csc3 [Chloroflexus sp.]